MNVSAVIRDAIARVVAAQEALSFGDTEGAFALLVDLEADLVGSLAVFCMEEQAA